MGNNVDLTHLLGLPETMQCPHCSTTIKTHFNDHDIECCTYYNRGLWKTSLYCPECGKDFPYSFKVHIETLK